MHSAEDFLVWEWVVWHYFTGTGVVTVKWP